MLRVLLHFLIAFSFGCFAWASAIGLTKRGAPSLLTFGTGSVAITSPNPGASFSGGDTISVTFNFTAPTSTNFSLNAQNSQSQYLSLFLLNQASGEVQKISNVTNNLPDTDLLNVGSSGLVTRQRVLDPSLPGGSYLLVASLTSGQNGAQFAMGFVLVHVHNRKPKAYSSSSTPRLEYSNLTASSFVTITSLQSGSSLQVGSSPALSFDVHNDALSGVATFHAALLNTITGEYHVFSGADLSLFSSNNWTTTLPSTTTKGNWFLVANEIDFIALGNTSELDGVGTVLSFPVVINGATATGNMISAAGRLHLPVLFLLSFVFGICMI